MTQILYPSPVAVAGATGTQGGATARALLRAGRPVRALTRKPDSPAAQALRELGAEIAYADFAKRSTVDAALAGAGALFAVTTPFGTDVEQEVRDGHTLLDAAVAAGTVEHVVFTSATNADRDTGIPHFESKRRIERHLADLPVAWTVIAPAAFMDQYAESWTTDSLRQGLFGRPMPPDKPLALIAAEDIGAFATLVLSRPAEFAGRRLDIASDELTCVQIADTLGAACGLRVRFQEYPLSYVEKRSADLAAMFRYFSTVGMDVDVAGLRWQYPEVGWHTLGEWAAENAWRLTHPTSTSDRH